MYRVSGFVTPKEIEEAGIIAGAFENGEYLTSNMPVYLKLKNKGSAKMGDRSKELARSGYTWPRVAEKMADTIWETLLPWSRPTGESC